MSPCAPRLNVGKICLWLLLALSATASRAQEGFPARDLTIKGIYGMRANDGGVYCLVGSGACLVPQDKGIADAFIANWLMAHPNATAIPISTEAKVLPLRAPPRWETFVWIEDGPDSLSLSLVREGFYSAHAMADMVDTENRFTDMQDKAFSNDERIRNEMAKRRSQVPEANRPRRLIRDSDYDERMKLAMAAEQDAKQQEKGLWADATTRPLDASIADRMSRESFPAHDLYLSGIAAHRVGDPDVYCLVGQDVCANGMSILVGVGNDVEFVTKWMTMHPHATATPISVQSKKILLARPAVHSTYIWIEDGKDSVNVSLVKEGFYRAQAMIDMVESGRNFMKMFDDPRLATGRAEIEKERADEQAPQRLISDTDYADRMKRLAAAEQDAKQNKRGLWSDAEMKRWNPPADAQMLKDYSDHKPWFKNIVSLVDADPRLVELSRDPDSWKRARSAGVSQARIEQYVHLLEQLGANETLASVYGLGKACLITADITVGLFDNGVIKGYVFAPFDPRPLVKDLENLPSDVANATTAYRQVADNWYLFEVRH
jgi:endonuclease YncB( thermonuclease family)